MMSKLPYPVLSADVEGVNEVAVVRHEGLEVKVNLDLLPIDVDRA